MRNLLLIFILLLFGISCKSPKNLVKQDEKAIFHQSMKNDSEINKLDTVCSSIKSGDSDGITDLLDVDSIKSAPPKIHLIESSNEGSVSIPIKTRNISNDEIVLPGILAYHIPDTMSVHTDYTVKIRITRTKDTNKIKITSNIGGSVTTEIIKTTEKMYVDLIDSSPDSSFIIKKINDNEQMVDSSDYTEWVYSVRPIKNGDKKLSLVISIIKDGNKKQIVYSDTIHVKDNIVKDVKTFWGKYWQWLFTTFLIPIFIYFWKKRDKKNNS